MKQSCFVVFAILAAVNAGIYHGDANFLAHSALISQDGLVRHAGFPNHVAAYSVPEVAVSHSSIVHPSVYAHGYAAPVLAHSAVAQSAVTHSAALVQGSDTEAVVAGPSGTVTRSGGVFGHTVTAPAVYSAYTPFVAPLVTHHAPVVAHHAPGVIATDHQGDSLVAGPSGTVSTSAGHVTHYTAPVVAAHGW